MSKNLPLGAATIPVAGVSVLALVAGIGYTLFVGSPETAQMPVPNPATSSVEALDAPSATPSGAAQDATTVDESDTGADAGDTAAAEQTAASSTPASTPTPTTPEVDVIRIPADGFATLAGRAGAGDEVVIYLDGAEVARATAGDSGEFVALFEVEPSTTARELQVGVAGAAGVTFAEESLLVAPTVAPVDAPVAAEAEVEPEADTAVADAGTQAQAAQSEAETAPETETETETAQAAQEAPTVLRATDEGVQVVQGGASQTRIDALTYDPDGRVFASGRAAPDSVMRLYLDNALTAETVTGADGQWRVELADVAAGLYTLRADSLDATGKVLARVETPFKREDIATLAALAQIEPEEAAKAEPEMTQEAAPETEQETAPEATQETTPDAPQEIAQETAQETETPTADAATETADATQSTDDVQTSESAQVESAPEPAQEPAQKPGQETSAAPGDAVTDATADEATVETTDATPDASIAEETTGAAETVVPQRLVSITVQPGNTLWGIATERYGNGFLFAQVFDANREQIRDPDLIYPGQVFVLPKE